MAEAAVEAVAMAEMAMAVGAQMTALAVVVAIKGGVEEAAVAMAARGAATRGVAAVVVATGSDHGRRRSNFRWDHLNSKGGDVLDKCKLDDGSRNVDSIMDGLSWKLLQKFREISNFLSFCQNEDEKSIFWI